MKYYNLENAKTLSWIMRSLNSDQVNLVSRKLVDWLRYASMQQGASMSSGGFFSGPRTRQVGHVSFLYSSVPSPSINWLRRKWPQWTAHHLSTSLHQPAPLTEVDGVVTGDFFTVLCLGQSYTEDQWMNMYTFSMIKSWMLTYDTDGTTNAESGSPNRDVAAVGLLYDQGYFSITNYIIC